MPPLRQNLQSRALYPFEHILFMALHLFMILILSLVIWYSFKSKFISKRRIMSGNTAQKGIAAVASESVQEVIP